MDFIAQLIESLAWPIATIWLGYLFRGEIRNLFGRVSQLKYKDLEAKFEKEIATAEAEAKEVLEISRKRGARDEEPVYPQPYDEKYAQLLRIAEESPRAALLEAWVEVESELLKTAERKGLGQRYRGQLSQLVISLINEGDFAKTVLPLFEDLRILRNQAAHEKDFQPSQRHTRRFLQLAIELALTLKNI